MSALQTTTDSPQLTSLAQQMEAILLVAAQPVPAQDLAYLLGIDVDQVSFVAHRLNADYFRHGIHLVSLSEDSYALVTKPEHSALIARMLDYFPAYDGDEASLNG